jgi:hypothetical protein
MTRIASALLASVVAQRGRIASAHPNRRLGSTAIYGGAMSQVSERVRRERVWASEWNTM